MRRRRAEPCCALRGRKSPSGGSHGSCSGVRRHPHAGWLTPLDRSRYRRGARGLSGLERSVVRALRPGARPFSRRCQALDAPPGRPLAEAERVAAGLAHRAPGGDRLEGVFPHANAEERVAFLDAGSSHESLVPSAGAEDLLMRDKGVIIEARSPAPRAATVHGGKIWISLTANCARW